ncbi:MAG: hypothetical protein J7K26_01900 [Candidatus Aenigmarchaeota archaeon]|nr:hypothetical protein [Candidatus Aenigmarchaeota archaeon]
MKGQFFIIATVIIIASLITITTYFYDYSKIDLTNVYDIQEIEFINDIKDSLIQTAEISYSRSGCLTFENDMIDTENFLKNKLLEKGIILDFIESSKNCPGNNGKDYELSYKFTLKSNNFESTTEFVV